MLDSVFLDQLYDDAIAQFGQPLSTFLFNKRMLLPLELLPDAVERECDEELDAWRIPDLRLEGWFPVLPGAGDDGRNECVPLYIPSRVGLFLELERQGWSAEELRAFARFEENLVDEVLTTDELAYEDDDQTLLVRHVGEIIQELEEEQIHRLPMPARPPGWVGTGRSSQFMAMDDNALAEAIVQHRDVREHLRGVPCECRSPENRHRLGRQAHRIRMADEMLRVAMLNEDRQQVKAGFSRAIRFTGSYNLFGPFSLEGRSINWAWTLHDPWVANGLEDIVLRLPGFVLLGGTITMTPAFPPAEYAERWERYDLEEYLRLHGQARTDRRCLHCRRALEPHASSTSGIVMMGAETPPANADTARARSASF